MSEKNKEGNKEPEINYYNKQMTLKPTQKIRRKNKKTNLQKLYNEGKVTSEEFYTELIKFIKWRLMPDLIRRGYYLNGVRQNNFTRDECDACYTHVLHKIVNEYSPERGTIATYIGDKKIEDSDRTTPEGDKLQKIFSQMVEEKVEVVVMEVSS